MKEKKLNEIFNLIDYFKPILLMEEKDIDQLGIDFMEKLKLLSNQFENVEEYYNSINTDFRFISQTFEPSLKYENKIKIFDILIYKYLLTKLFTNEMNIYTLKGILKTKTEPNYLVLSKIFSKSENGQEKIKIENILDLIFGKPTHDAMKSILISEYLLQRGTPFKMVLINLIKVKFILWLMEFEPKSISWLLDLFEEPKKLEEAFIKIDAFR